MRGHTGQNWGRASSGEPGGLEGWLDAVSKGRGTAYPGVDGLRGKTDLVLRSH
jgi:hypothetical protein